MPDQTVQMRCGVLRRELSSDEILEVGKYADDNYPQLDLYPAWIRACNLYVKGDYKFQVIKKAKQMKVTVEKVKPKQPALPSSIRSVSPKKKRISKSKKKRKKVGGKQPSQMLDGFL